MTPALTLDQISHRFGETLALDNISLALDAPGIHGLLGRNGSGKSTLFSLIAGLRKPTSGRISLNNMPIYEHFPATSDICIIRETGDTTADWSETVRDSFALARDLRPYWNEDYAKRLLDLFELSMKAKVADMSRGQRARLAATLGLAARAPLTLLDEVYAGMDAPSRYQFYDALLEDYMEWPRIFLLSSHHVEEVSKLFEQVMIIDEGRLLLHESADALRGRGMTLTGPVAEIDALTVGHRVLSHNSLGGTKASVVYDAPPELMSQAIAKGIETSPLPLQDVFVHLTSRPGKDKS